MSGFKVLMVGASGGGEMMGDILCEAHPEAEIDYIDDDTEKWGTKICGRKVIPVSTEHILSVLDNYTYAFISVGLHKHMKFREKMYHVLKGKIPLINIIHPTSYISETASIGEGNYFGAFSFIGPRSVVGDCNFFSGNTLIEHHNKIGNLNSWGPSNTTSGFCAIGDRVCLGTNISMVFHVNIGEDSVVASDTCLSSKVKSNSLVRKNNYPDYTIKSFRGWK